MAAPGRALYVALIKPLPQAALMPAVAAALAPHVHSTHGQLAHGAARSGRPVLRGGRAAAAHADCGGALIERLHALVVALFDDCVSEREKLEPMQLLDVA